MYLFQPKMMLLTFEIVILFTFHYVSISTATEVFNFVTGNEIYIPLCIYFNDISAEIESAAFKFTFHYVSISTHVVCALNSVGKVFTFHYVSISTSIH